MYLLPARPRARSATKGLSAYRLGCCPRRFSGLGQDTIFISTGPNATVPSLPTVPSAPLSIDELNQIFGPGAPPMPPVQAPGPAPTAYSSVLTSAQNSQNPTDYVSPQAAIAAGLDPQKVYAAWSGALAKFPSQQAALAAGVPAGVVTQLWAASRSAAPAPSASFLDQAPLGIANKYIVGGAAAILLLSGLRRK
jgi:hypothetical protein